MATKNLGRVVGYSAYEIWLQQGNEGTIDDYLNSLKGGPGNDGHTPVKGEDYFTEEDIQSLNIPTKTSELENDSGYVNEEKLNEATSNIVTSYNDLEDKPFGEVIEETVVIPEGIYSTLYNKLDNHILLVAGKEYTVIYGGTEYKCVAQELMAAAAAWTGVGIGNNALVSEYGDETPEYPFCVVDNGKNTYAIGLEDDTKTLEVKTGSLVTKQIDPKFIPSEYVTEEELNNATSNIVTSYNDLEDKPFGEIIEKVEVIPNGTPVTTSISMGYNDTYWGLFNDRGNYLVVYNGVEYECEPMQQTFEYNVRRTYIGNGNLVYDEIEASDYPFCIMNSEDASEYTSCIIKSESETDTIGVTLLFNNFGNNLKQIDPKFIPSEYVTEEELNNATSNIVTSYNDLTDKPFGEETTPYNCIPEDTVITNGNSYYREEGFIGLGGLGADLKYLVNFNGAEYLCETIGVYEYENYIGNPHYLDESLESNEYPFCILADSYSEVYRIYFDGDADTTAVISLYELVTNTKQIDSKYIPSKYATKEYVTNAINEAIGIALEGEY